MLALLTAGRPCAGQERTAAPAFGSRRNLLVLSESHDNGLGLTTVDIRTAETTERRFYPIASGRVLSPSLKVDHKGQAWAVWEEWGDSQSRIGLGRLSASGVISPKNPALKAGWNCSPDLTFDLNDHPWLAWVNDRIGAQTLFIQDIDRKKTWLLAEASSFLNPQLFSDSQGRIWVFWTATVASQSRFYYRVYNGVSWSPTVGIGTPSSFPIHSFSAVLDAQGIPRMVWSQSDGRQYKIFGLLKGVGPTAPVVQISTGSGGGDVFPSLGLLNGSTPVVSWVRSTQKGNSLVLKYSEGAVWSGEKEVSECGGSGSVPQMIVRGEEAAFVWWTEGRLQWRVVSLGQMAGLIPSTPPKAAPSVPAAAPPSPASPPVPYNPNLDESKYIGFGDSITYGVIDSEYHPDLGYIPRLQNGLSLTIGPTTVVNEGYPSEITMHGLARLGDVLDQDKGLFILILEGTNDTITKIYSLEATAFNLQEMARQCKAVGVLPALATLLPRYDQNAKMARVLDINLKIREIAQEAAVPLVDLYQAFIDYPPEQGGTMSLISGDGLHPNEKGYQFMADQWQAAVRDFPFAPWSFNISRGYGKMRAPRNQGLLISWLDNPKIADPRHIQGYRLYRKVGAGSAASFQFLALVTRPRIYFDWNVSLASEVEYAIAALMSGGVEGPCSSPAKY
jgi:lysophospholipase L1-like esterase